MIEELHLNSAGVKSFMVSVCIITYGHEQYIKKALESVFMQKCSFHVEIVISNDASPDNTDEIIKELLKTYKGDFAIRYYHRLLNIGMVENFLFTAGKCAGKYIAMLEGDDYWVDECKLEKQIAHLEQHPNASLCFHKTDELHVDGTIKTSSMTWSKPEAAAFTMTDLAAGNLIHTPSVIFRAKDFSFPDVFHKAPLVDYLLWLKLASKGTILYLPDCMAHYRLGVGVWSGAKKQMRLEQWFQTLQLCINYFTQPDVQTRLHQQIEQTRSQIAELAFIEFAKEADDLSVYVPLKQLAYSFYKGILRKITTRG